MLVRVVLCSFCMQTCMQTCFLWVQTNRPQWRDRGHGWMTSASVHCQVRRVALRMNNNPGEREPAPPQQGRGAAALHRQREAGKTTRERESPRHPNKGEAPRHSTGRDRRCSSPTAKSAQPYLAATCGTCAFPLNHRSSGARQVPPTQHQHQHQQWTLNSCASSNYDWQFFAKDVCILWFECYLECKEFKVDDFEQYWNSFSVFEGGVV